MIKHIWSVLCQSASFDAQTNRVSLFNVIESFNFSKSPSVEHPILISCEIISLWAREPDAPITGEMQIFLNAPETKFEQPISLNIDLTQSIFHRTRLSINALALTSPGRYEFEIQYREKGNPDWFSAAKLPIVVSGE